MACTFSPRISSRERIIPMGVDSHSTHPDRGRIAVNVIDEDKLLYIQSLRVLRRTCLLASKTVAFDCLRLGTPIRSARGRHSHQSGFRCMHQRGRRSPPVEISNVDDGSSNSN